MFCTCTLSGWQKEGSHCRAPAVLYEKTGFNRRMDGLWVRGSSTGRRVVCDDCGKSFAHGGALKRHKTRSHGAAEFPFFCSQCNKGFSEKHHFEGHMNVHNNIRPHICPYCGKGHAYRTGLNNHLKTCKGIK
jgi:uncharacterized Zn-finger protein